MWASTQGDIRTWCNGVSTMDEEVAPTPGRILVIRRGFGGRDAFRYKALSSVAKSVEMPSSYDPEMESETEVPRYAKLIRSYDPDLLCSSSSGATILYHLIDRGLWTGPVWIVNARCSPPSLIDRALDKDVVMLFSHAERDGVPPRAMERRVAGRSARAAVLPFPGSHRAEGLFENDDLVRTHLRTIYELSRAKKKVATRKREDNEDDRALGERSS